jgi:hypothetical protein
MDVTVVSKPAFAAPHAEPQPVVLVLGSGRTPKALSDALATEGFHTIHASGWAKVRALAGFLRPDLLLLVPESPEELAWRTCFARDVPELTLSRSADIAGLRWPVRWRTLVVAVRHRIEHGAVLAMFR